MKEILIYSDGVSSSGKYRSLLEDAEINVSHRCNLQESISHINLKMVDLVIIDLDIPIFTDRELWDATPFTSREIPIIIVVNEIDNGTLDRCITDFDIEVVKKQHFNSDAFSEIINKMLGLNYKVNEINDECELDTPFCDTDNAEDT